MSEYKPKSCQGFLPGMKTRTYLMHKKPVCFIRQNRTKCTRFPAGTVMVASAPSSVSVLFLSDSNRTEKKKKNAVYWKVKITLHSAACKYHAGSQVCQHEGMDDE